MLTDQALCDFILAHKVGKIIYQDGRVLKMY